MSPTENGENDERTDELANLVSLDCARVADSLAEGALGEGLESHVDSCASCGSLVTELESITSLIGEATAPVTPPADFAARVLDRANMLTLDLETDPVAHERSDRGRWPLVAALASAAAIGLAFWAGGLNAQLEVPDAPSDQVAVAPAEIPSVADHPDETPQGEVTLRPAGGSLEIARDVEAVAIAEPLVIPEPTLDIPAEIQAALLQVIEDKEGCPRTSGGTVRITATVEATGAIVDRQIVSSGDAKLAHRCVIEALDGLRLPPLAKRARVTLDVRW